MCFRSRRVSNEAEPDGVNDGRQKDEAQKEDVQEEVHVAARVEEHRDRLKQLSFRNQISEADTAVHVN